MHLFKWFIPNGHWLIRPLIVHHFTSTVWELSAGIPSSALLLRRICFVSGPRLQHPLKQSAAGRTGSTMRCIYNASWRYTTGRSAASETEIASHAGADKGIAVRHGVNCGGYVHPTSTRVRFEGELGRSVSYAWSLSFPYICCTGRWACSSSAESRGR